MTFRRRKVIEEQISKFTNEFGCIEVSTYRMLVLELLLDIRQLLHESARGESE